MNTHSKSISTYTIHFFISIITAFLRKDKFYENTGFPDIQKGDEYEEVDNKIGNLALWYKIDVNTKVTLHSKPISRRTRTT